MKNISIDMWRQSPVYTMYIKGIETYKKEEFDRSISPIVNIIVDYFIWAYVEQKLCEPFRPIIFGKNLNILKHAII